jgi:hypothetical protein
MPETLIPSTFAEVSHWASAFSHSQRVREPRTPMLLESVERAVRLDMASWSVT